MQFQIKNFITQLFPESYIDFTPLGYPWKKMWPLENKFPTDDKTKHIVFQDCLTFNGTTCLELEWYKQNILDIDNYIFYSPHYNLHTAYPELKIVYFNWILYLNSYQYNKSKQLFLKHFLELDRPQKTLCLMRNRRPHRDLIYNCLKHNKSLNMSYQAIGQEPDFPGISINKYWNSNIPNVRNFLSLIKNYQQASHAYVVETMYNEPFPFVTEKTLQPLLAKLTIIPLCQARYIENLSYLGFDMSFLDDEFDTHQNSTRFRTAIDINQDVCDININHNQTTALNVWSILLDKLQYQLQEITR